MANSFINLDAAAEVPMLPQLAEKYPQLVAEFGLNPHGGTIYAERCRRQLLQAEEALLEAAGIPMGDAAVIWCASATEAANIAIRGFCQHPQNNFRGNGENAAAFASAGASSVLLAMDGAAHPAITQTAAQLGEHRSFILDSQGHAPAIAPASLVALSAVNHELGIMWDGDAAPFGQDATVLLDASQAFCRHAIPWRGVHLVILSARKIGGPASAAALVVRRGTKLGPVITGGGQQGGVRSGTVDTVNAMLFAEAAKIGVSGVPSALSRVRQLNRVLRDGINRLGGGKWPILSPETASPYICCFAIPGYEAAIISRTLAQNFGILIGTGSACTAESNQVSPVLTAYGVDKATARSALRVSFMPETTPRELEQLLVAIPKVIASY